MKYSCGFVRLFFLFFTLSVVMKGSAAEFIVHTYRIVDVIVGLVHSCLCENLISAEVVVTCLL